MNNLNGINSIHFIMNDSAIRHVVAIIATIICLLVFYAGYISGQHGWPWTALGLLIVYGGVYKIIDK